MFWIIGFLGLIVVYILIKMIRYHNRTETNRREILKRGIDFQKHNNFLKSMWTRERIELTQQRILKTLDKTIYGFDMFGTIHLVVAEPDLIQSILSKEFQNFPNRRKINLNDDFFSNALSIVEGDQWKRIRAVVTPTFATGKMRTMKPIIDSVAEKLIQNIQNNLKPHCPLNMKNFVSAFTMDTIIQVSFGLKVDSLTDKDNPIIKMARKMFNVDLSVKNMLAIGLVFFGPRFLQPLLKHLRFNGEVIDFFRDLSNKIIEEKKLEISMRKDSKASNFIEFLLEAEKEYSNLTKSHPIESFEGKKNEKSVKYITKNELISQSILFLIAGFDTTATLINLACYYLALNPDKQDLAYEEIISKIKELDIADWKSRGNEILKEIPFEWYSNKFDYLNAITSETLRMTPPAPFLERRAENDCTLSYGNNEKIEFKKGDMVQIPVWFLHYSERHFSQPELFLPERFLKENIDKIHKYAYLPFGSGPRVCVAKSLALMEAKIALVWLIKNFKFYKCAETLVPLQFFHQGGVLSPKSVNLLVEKRID